jgi:isoleucyl-tRNA synthetase
MVPALSDDFAENLTHVKDLILSEVNVKELELLSEDNSVLVKSIKPNFKTIGPKYGKHMKAIAAEISKMDATEIAEVESSGVWEKEISGETVTLDSGDFDITAQDIPGWLVSSEGNLTVALDVTIDESLKAEGIARELVNRVQNLRKDSGLEVTDRILLQVETNEIIQDAITQNKEYVCNEVLANDINFVQLPDDSFITDLVDKEDSKINIVGLN